MGTILWHTVGQVWQTECPCSRHYQLSVRESNPGCSALKCIVFQFTQLLAGDDDEQQPRLHVTGVHSPQDSPKCLEYKGNILHHLRVPHSSLQLNMNIACE